jgi:hypothetical protein
MIQPTFGTLLMPTVGAPPLLKAGMMTAFQAATALSTVAVLTDQKQRLTVRTKTLPKHHFALHGRHCLQGAGLDNCNCFVAP